MDSKSLIQKLVGVNWKTTITGVGLIAAVISKILLAYRTKDFATIFSSGQELVTDIAMVLTALGLLTAKDYDTKGAGDAAVKVDQK